MNVAQDRLVEACGEPAEPGEQIRPPWFVLRQACPAASRVLRQAQDERLAVEGLSTNGRLETLEVTEW
jgi:hypothetical protein